MLTVELVAINDPGLSSPLTRFGRIGCLEESDVWDALIQDLNCDSELRSSRCTPSDDQNNSWGSVHTDDFWLKLLEADPSNLHSWFFSVTSWICFP